MCVYIYIYIERERYRERYILCYFVVAFALFYTRFVGYRGRGQCRDPGPPPQVRLRIVGWHLSPPLIITPLIKKQPWGK